MEAFDWTKLDIEKPNIMAAFENLSAKIFTISEIELFIAEYRSNSQLGKSITIDQIIGHMLKETKLREIKIKFLFQKIIRYTWGQVSDYGLVLSPGITLLNRIAL